MKAKKSKGDGVFNKKNGLVSQRGSVISAPKVSQKFAQHNLKNTGSSHSVGMAVNKGDEVDLKSGHRKLSGSLLPELQSEQSGMGNVFNEKIKQPKSSADYTMQPVRGKTGKKGY